MCALLTLFFFRGKIDLTKLKGGEIIKSFLGKYKEYIFFALCFIALILTMMLLHIPCPIKYLTGMSCAGCGMTRALLSALSLDFHAAFYYHPLWILLFPTAILLILFRAKNKKIAFNAVLSCVVILFFAVWIYRLACGDDIVAFDFDDSAINQAIQWIAGR